ncbi:ferritin family protein [Hydrogenimonas urashimensis]|uniref:ferritin family protein n=1 Tax=Hydrogenimonas urashimensis TaxID=2740515 RepID=UPI00191665EA|nr:ferritin family protein [Hydrogenimonas urashimensis]
MRQYETYKCNKCGNEVEVQKVGGGTLVCCGEEMVCTTENLTAVNLMKAFAGESMARNKYEFFAEMAQEEGWHRIAEHFKEAAMNEKYHAKAEFKAYNQLMFGIEIYETLKNLDIAMAGEHYEHTEMYPNFAKIAEEEGHKDIARLLKAIAKVEVEHEREYAELKKCLEEEGFFDSDEDEYWVCEVCGHVHRGKKAPKACPLCKAPREYFKREHLC